MTVMAVKMACILLVWTGASVLGQSAGPANVSSTDVDLYVDLWEGSLDIANKTLKEDFLQSMQGAQLPADRYMTFILQDLYYLVEVTAMLEVLKETTQEPDIRTFFERRHKSYQTFADYLLKEYHLKDASSIIPWPAIRSYVQSYRNIMKREKPIYFVVAMLPCARLWPFLAQNLDINTNTAYYNWKKDNSNSHAEKNYRPLLDKYAASIKQKKAMKLFKRQMRHERAFFKEAYQILSR